VASNQAAREAGAVLGEHCYSTWPGRSTPCPWCLAPEVWDEGKDRRLEVESDGVIWDAHWWPVGDDLYLHYAFDITAQRRMERELQNTEKLESLGVLAGGIAHDFNNILSGVLGNLSLARLDLADRPDILETLKDAEKATLRAKDLTKQLLTFARGGAPVKTTASLQELIEETSRFIFRGSKIKPILTFGDNLPHASIDPGQISQVFNNLFINAIQAMDAGGMVFVRGESFHVQPGETSLLAPGRYLRVTVADQGSGVPAEVLPKIFDPYFSTKKTGSGLGLSLSHSIVKQHGGTITADSEPGQGTTFTICLPAAKEGPESHPRETPGIIRGTGRLLLIDDEPGVLRVVSMMLERLGYTVETAPEGRAGVIKYQDARDRGEPFDAVITDLTIPGGMGGIEVVRELALIDPGVKVIVASGYSDDQALSRPEKFGFLAAVTKPVALAELSKVINEAVAGTKK
jgi:signal transduction histidine kinase/CheY-like chemotaxis protein